MVDINLVKAIVIKTVQTDKQIEVSGYSDTEVKEAIEILLQEGILYQTTGIHVNANANVSGDVMKETFGVKPSGKVYVAYFVNEKELARRYGIDRYGNEIK